MANEHLVERAAGQGVYFRDRLRAIPSPMIREVRGLGLMIGIELKGRAMPVAQALMELGVLVLTAGSTVLRLLPPLVITPAEIDMVVEAIQDVLAQHEVGHTLERSVV